MESERIKCLCKSERNFRLFCSSGKGGEIKKIYSDGLGVSGGVGSSESLEFNLITRLGGGLGWEVRLRL
jgi:hypothetical protein